MARAADPTFPSSRGRTRTTAVASLPSGSMERLYLSQIDSPRDREIV
jgi:hypothetical protein